MTRLAFIGLGNMGTPMVQHLIAAGHTVRAYVRRPEAADNARALGAEPVATPAEAARDAEVIFTNVTSTADVEAVLLGPDGVIPVSYTHLTLPTKEDECRSRWSPYH